MPLSPDQSIHKVLLSTTSRLVGEYRTNNFALSLAWPQFNDELASSRWNSGPMSRSGYVFAFRTDQFMRQPNVRPSYLYIGDVLASYLSLIFGKRFDNHGLMEGMGNYIIPDMGLFNTYCKPKLPQNSHSPRSDYPVSLCLTEADRIAPLIKSLLTEDTIINEDFENTFYSACKFYHRSLQLFEIDSEAAYLSLITSGEILSNSQQFELEDLLDHETKSMLKSIRENLPDGNRVANSFENRLRSVKKRFVKTITSLIDDDFFSRTEATTPETCMSAELFESTIKAAYDLRSKYVHTGHSFGSYIESAGIDPLGEISRHWHVPDKELGKIVYKSPTYIGLERVIRYCLLKYAENNGAFTQDAAKSI